MQAAAQTALDGTPEDVRYFLALWRQVAANHDDELEAVQERVDAAMELDAEGDAEGPAAADRAGELIDANRDANITRLADQQAKAQHDAQIAAGAEGTAQQQARDAAARAAQAKADNDKLLADAADPALTVPDGRRASAYLLRNGSPRSRMRPGPR